MAPAIMHVTEPGAGAKTGADWANAMGLTEFQADAIAGAEAGDVYYLDSGTYTLVAPLDTARNGTPTAPVRIIGVWRRSTPITYADWALGAQRPEIVCNGGNYCWLQDYWQLHNLSFSGTANIMLGFNYAGLFQRSKLVSTGTTYGLRMEQIACRAINSELACSGGPAVYGHRDSLISGCYIHHSPVGLRSSGWEAFTVLNNIIANCPTAIDLANGVSWRVIGNTLYNGTTGILATTAYRGIAERNIISGFTTPAEWGTEQLSNWFDWNCWHNSDAPVNVTKGPGAINQDPLFYDAPANDFRPNLPLPAPGIVPATLGTIPIGAIVFDWPPAARAGVNMSQDHLVFDGLEDVTLDGTLVPNAYRLPDNQEEGDPSEGAYLHRETVFQLPTDPVILPAVGSTLVAAGVTFTALQIRRPAFGDFWGLTCREMAITADVDLRDLVTLYPGVDVTDEWGSKITSHTVPHDTFVDVPAKIQIQPSVAEDRFGKRDIIQKFDVYVDGDIGDVSHGDLLQDQDANWYVILDWRNRTRIDELSVILCSFPPGK